jgi:hypothetical protein|nr:MAG TPA: Protein of unknown function (DUF2481) [Caudoviricetes sp.]
MFTLTTPTDVYTAPTLEGLRTQIVEEWAKYGTSDNINFADQVHAVFPSDPSELDEDEQLPQVRPLTPELLVELAAWALSEHPKHIKLETVDARTIEDVAEVVAAETGCEIEAAHGVLADLAGLHAARGDLSIDPNDLTPRKALLLKAEAALIISESQADNGIIGQLEDAQQVLEQAERAVVEARDARDRALRSASREGVSVAQLRAATGLSRPAVYKILGK